MTRRIAQTVSLSPGHAALLAGQATLGRDAHVRRGTRRAAPRPVETDAD